MTVTGAQVARVLRDRRRALGLTRTRLAERSGVAAADIARWERGDGIPPPAELSLLASAVGLDGSETRAWLDSTITIDLTEPEVSVEIVPGAPRPANPFSEPIELKRVSSGLTDRFLARINDLRPGKPSAASSSRLRSLPGGTPRPAPSERTGLAAPPRRAVESKPAPRRADRFVPAVRPIPVPMPPVDPAVEERAYRVRRIATTVALIGLAVALWWSFGALGEGIGDLFDMFRSPLETPISQLR